MFLYPGAVSVYWQFIKLFLWISVPVIVVSLVIGTIVHYRRKRRRAAAAASTDEAGDPLMQLPDDEIRQRRGEQPPLDQNELLFKYKERLSYSLARYAALKSENNNLKNRISAMIKQPTQALLTEKTQELARYEETIRNYEQEMSLLRDQTAELEKKIEGTHDYEEIKSALADRQRDISILNELLTGLKEELQAKDHAIAKEAQLRADAIQQTDKEREPLLAEVEILRQRIGDMEKLNENLKQYHSENLMLKDLVDEKKAEIGFLQNQLEQRVEKQHQQDEKLAEANRQIEAEQQQANQLRDEIRGLNDRISQRSEDYERMQDTLHERSNQITYLESGMRELKEQNEMLQASVSDNQDIINALRHQLQLEKEKISLLEQKLKANKDVLHHIYHEIGSQIGIDKNSKKVLALDDEVKALFELGGE